MVEEKKQDAAGYIVKFKKWDDPLRNTIKRASKKSFHNDDEEEDEGDFDNDYSGPVAATDYGIMPINEETCLSTRFNFWEGRTNFLLENYHKFLIDTTLGVETNDIKTPYRFKIAIAPLFNEKDVLKRVETRLLDYNKELEKQIKENEKKNQPKVENIISIDLHSVLTKQHKFYAIVKFEDKKQVISGTSEKDVEEKVSNFAKTHNLTQINVEYSWKKGN